MVAVAINFLIPLTIHIHCTADSVQSRHDVEPQMRIVDAGDEAKERADVLDNPVEVLVVFVGSGAPWIRRPPSWIHCKS